MERVLETREGTSPIIERDQIQAHKRPTLRKEDGLHG